MLLYRKVSIFPLTEKIKKANLNALVFNDPHSILCENSEYNEYDDEEYYNMLYGDEYKHPEKVFQERYLKTTYQTYNAAGGTMIQITVTGYQNMYGETFWDHKEKRYYRKNMYIV